ncbi:unnamed protein product [Ambrosiozyma monospora]|uniref:Unnamed protein product n=1 Tax=Ambrosiozyma monospora TaxID=43982 RepID=A0A9W7DIA9_AMBMO|nr:unnamed protein product [Ambrosiozyma monospora]
MRVADQRNGVPTLQTIRKGMCAGAVDISRIFSRRNDHLSPDESHDFSMKLYASYMTEESQVAPFKLYSGIGPLLSMPMTMENNGWGKLIDRIISGSNKGIAINPRLDMMNFKIKELKNDSFLSESQSDPAIAVIRTLFYDPIEANYDRIYLKVNRIIDIVSSVKLPTLSSIFKKKVPDFVTASVRSSCKKLKFSKGSNEHTQSSWNFISTSIGENVGEVIQISGLSAVPAKDKDVLYFDVFVNGVFHASGKYTLRINNQILSSELISKRSKRVELFSQNSTSPVGAIEITLEYVGKHYNIDPCIDKLLNWESIYDKSLMSSGNELIYTLTQVRKTGIQTVVKFFPQLMFNLLQIYRFASEKNLILSVYGACKDMKFKTLADTCFVSIVHILEMAIARQDDYVYLFDELLETLLPKVGNFLMKDMIAVLGDFENTWNSTCCAICRVCPLISTLAINSIDDCKQFVLSADTFAFETIPNFLASNEETFIPDQLALLDNLELILDALKPVYDEYRITTYVAAWSNAVGMQGFGDVEELSTNALINKKKSKQHLFIVKKMICISRFARSFLSESTNAAARDLLISTCVSSALDVIVSPKIDIDVSRLAFGVILGVIEASLEAESSYKIFDNGDIHLIFCRLMPIMCDTFNRYFAYCKAKNMLKPKMTFTQLFPTVYPFEEQITDSNAREEPFCECLMELTVLICICNRIACTVENSLVAAFTNSHAYTGNFSALDKYIGSTSEYCLDLFSLDDQTRSSKNLSKIIVKAFNEMVYPTYYPGSRWLSLKALANASVAEIFSYAVNIAFIPPSEKADSFNHVFWRSFFYCSLRTATSKVSSLEHLNQIAAKACFNITGDIRTRVAEGMYSAWKRMGFPVSEETQKRFSIDRVGGLQKHIWLGIFL